MKVRINKNMSATVDRKVMSIRRLCWALCHGRSRMRRWVQLFLAVTFVTIVLQCVFYINGRPFIWSPSGNRGASLNSSFWSQMLDSATTVTRQDQDLPINTSHVNKAYEKHPFSFVLNEPKACSNTTELIIVVITAINNTADRQAVRDTWGSYRTDKHHNTSLVFLLGSTPDPKLQAELVQESLKYRDIVQEDFVDSYRNLSLKSVALLKWVSMYCNSSKYVLKADDDMYVNVTNLIAALRKESLSHSTYVLGHVFTGTIPVQNKESKWYVSKDEFSEKVYPRYASGTAYSMTTSTALKLFVASAYVPVFWLEDIYVTGLCARKAGVSVYHHGGFSYTKQKIDGCHFRKVITGHHYTADEKRTIFKMVQDPNLRCS